MSAHRAVTIAAALRPVPGVPMVSATARMRMMGTAQQNSPDASLATLTAERNALAVTEGLQEGALWY